MFVVYSNIEAWPYGTSLRFASAFRALGVCEHIWPFSLQDIWATLCRRNGMKFLSLEWLVTKRTCTAPWGRLCSHLAKRGRTGAKN